MCWGCTLHLSYLRFKNWQEHTMSCLYKLFTFFVLLLFNLNLLAINVVEPDKKSVKVNKIVTTEIYDVYKYPVSVEPKYEREMYADITGFVQNIYVSVGEWVKKDTILMQLKPIGPGYTDKAFDIKSPFNGQITKIAKKIGSHIKPNDLLLQVMEPTILILKIEIPQAELKLLTVAQQGEAEFRTTEQVLPVIVTGISSFVEPTTGTATGQLDWDHTKLTPALTNIIKQNIYPGMLGYVAFKLNKRHGIIVPNQAIFVDGEDNKVRIVKDGKSMRVKVQLGKRLDNGTSEVIAGLATGDLVIVTTAKYLRENEKVTVQQE